MNCTSVTDVQFALDLSGIEENVYSCWESMEI